MIKVALGKLVFYFKSILVLKKGFILNFNLSQILLNGGSTGIRTLDPITEKAVFKTAAIDR
jgi:hypothetical protein